MRSWLRRRFATREELDREYKTLRTARWSSLIFTTAIIPTTWFMFYLPSVSTPMSALLWPIIAGFAVLLVSPARAWRLHRKGVFPLYGKDERAEREKALYESMWPIERKPEEAADSTPDDELEEIAA